MARGQVSLELAAAGSILLLMLAAYMTLAQSWDTQSGDYSRAYAAGGILQTVSDSAALAYAGGDGYSAYLELPPGLPGSVSYTLAIDPGNDGFTLSYAGTNLTELSPVQNFSSFTYDGSRELKISNSGGRIVFS